MRPELETYQLIELYQKGELEGEVLKNFQSRLENDAEFAKEVSFQEMVNTLVLGSHIEDIRTQMSDDLKQFDKIDKDDKFKKWTLISVSGLIIGFGSMFFLMNSKEENVISKINTSSTLTTVTKIEKTIDTIRSENNSIQKKQNLIITSTSNNHTAPNTSKPTYSHADILISNSIELPVAHDLEGQTRSNNNTIELKNSNNNPCTGVLLKFEPIITDACIDKKDGKITIPLTKIEGGNPPFELSTNNSTATIFGETISDLGEGMHHIIITDALGCVQKNQIEIKERFCNLKSHIFAPEKGEVWKYIGLNNLSYTITIITQSGIELYKLENQIGTVEWNGTSKHGENLESGLYIYIIEYSNDTKDKGQITIVK